MCGRKASENRASSLMLFNGDICRGKPLEAASKKAGLYISIKYPFSPHFLNKM